MTVDERLAACRRNRDPDLSLARQGLTEVPGEVFRMPWITSLDLSANRIATIPDAIGMLTDLIALDVSNNTGLEFSDRMRTLARVEILDINSIGLQRFPDWIANLPTLTGLFLWGNGLTEIPYGSLAGLPRIRRLDLNGNALRSVPASIGALTDLTNLYLDANDLTDLPPEAGLLKRLRVANLASNLFTRLPDAVLGWASLQELDLRSESLSLRVRRLGPGTPPAFRSGLRQSPTGLQSLPGLRVLLLHGNPALDLPAEILGGEPSVFGGREGWDGSVTAILDYLDRTAEAARPLNEAKLILLGWGGAGKTSIVNRLVHGTFDEGERRTEGIAVTTWAVQPRPGEQATLNVWDFGGQEIMHATHQFFLTTRSVYLLVLSGRKGSTDADAEYWLKVIDSFARDAPVVVALNKIDLDPFDLDETGLRRSYPNIRRFIRTDCDTQEGIETLRAEVLAATDALPDLRVPFPAAWSEIKDRLSGMADDYLTFERYRALCGELGERDGQAQEQLAGFLHSLGIALNYRDDPRLRDTHVLNPHWVTEGIYAILNARAIAEQGGELRVDDLAGVLDPGRYPRERHPFLLDLMRRFGLCFPYPDGDTWLVPELLPKQQPEEVAGLAAPDDLRFEYGYPILPEGLLPRFVARSHALSVGAPRWRGGVVLRWEGNHAVVLLDASRNAVSISIGGGDTDGRRRLLAVVRADFEHLHRPFRFPVEQTIPWRVGSRRVPVAYADLVAAERAGRSSWPLVVDGNVVDLDVRGLLGGVDLAPVADRQPGSAARVFVSYSHRDDVHRERLDVQLKVLQQASQVSTWHDRRLDPGDDWRGTIDDELERADIVVCLVTPDFLASDYCRDVELRRARERHDAGECRVVPVIVRDSLWQRTSLAELQATPRDGRPIEEAPSRDRAWREVGDALAKVAEQARTSRR